LRGYAQAVERLPRAFASTLNALDFISEASLELVLVGDPDTAAYAALAGEIATRYAPNRIEARLAADHGSRLPLAEGKTTVDGQPALYVCRNFTCAAPVTTPAAAESLLTAPGERQLSL
jgi:uncharacterized protein YyaL (SSP411 family)